MPEIRLLGTDVVNTGALNPISVTHTLLAEVNRKVLVYVASEASTLSSCSGVTYGGVNMTKVCEISATGAAVNYIALFMLDESSLPANGAHSVEATFTAALGDSMIKVRSFHDIAQGQPSQFDTTGEGSPADATIENDLANPILSTQWAFSFTESGNVGSFTAGQGQVEADDFAGGSTTHMMSDLRGGSGQTQLTSTFVGTNNRLARLCAVWFGYGLDAQKAMFFAHNM